MRFISSKAKYKITKTQTIQRLATG